MNAPLTFAVIVPAYNRKQLLLETVASLLQQTTTGFALHVIVVDDGSSDGTGEALAEKFADKRLHYVHQPNRERGAARNLGAKVAIEQHRADWLLFFDSDDKLTAGALAAFCERVREAESDVVAVYAQIEPWLGGDARVNLNPKPARQFPQGDLATRMLRRAILPLGATLIRASTFQTLKGFSENRAMSGSEDFQFLLRLGFSGRILHLPRKTVLYRQHPTNTNPGLYLQSTTVAVEALKDDVQKRWPGTQGARAYRKLCHLCELSKVGALNQREFAPAAARSLVKLVGRRPSSLTDIRVWHLAASIFKRLLFYS